MRIETVAWPECDKKYHSLNKSELTHVYGDGVTELQIAIWIAQTQIWSQKISTKKCVDYYMFQFANKPNKTKWMTKEGNIICFVALCRQHCGITKAPIAQSW